MVRLHQPHHLGALPGLRYGDNQSLGIEKPILVVHQLGGLDHEGSKSVADEFQVQRMQGVE